VRIMQQENEERHPQETSKDLQYRSKTRWDPQEK
jgi:hypothetical protein